MGIKKLNKAAAMKVCDLFIDRLPRDWNADIFRKVAMRLGVETCTAAGEFGVFEAKVSDNVVFKNYMLNRTWSPDIHALINSMLQNKQGTYIDVGANVGLTLIPVKRDNPNVNAFGIEADSGNHTCLRQNIRRAEVGEITTFNCAVHSQEGEIEFEMSEDNAGDNRIKGGFASNGAKPLEKYGESKRRTVKVKCNRLDNLVDADELTRPIGIKCDIQGGEVGFLRGAPRVLAATDWLLCEYWPYGMSRLGSTTDEYFDVIREHFAFGQMLSPGFTASQELLPLEALIPQVHEYFGQRKPTIHADLLLSKTQRIVD